jgi:hypothetical protein
LVSLEKQSTPTENLVIATSELGEQLEVIGEPAGELAKTPAPQQVNNVNYLDSPTSSTTFDEGDLVAAKTSDGIWEEGFTVTFTASTNIGTRYRVERDDVGLNVGDDEIRATV